MRLDELEYPGWDTNTAVHSPATAVDQRPVGGVRVRVWKYPTGTFTVEREWSIDRYETWVELDPLTAQAVLFELCSRSDPC